MKRFARSWLAGVLLGVAAAGFGLLSCTSDSGGESRQISFNLADSLTKFSNVIILLVDANDPSHVIDTVHQGKIEDPKGLGTYSVPDSVKDFTIVVQGFDDAGLLAFQSTVKVNGGVADAAAHLPPSSCPARWPNCRDRA